MILAATISTATKATGLLPPISEEAKVNEAGAGMSACWLDFDNDGKQDIYAAGMWVAAGHARL